MSRYMKTVQQLLLNEVGIAALAYATSSSVFGMVVAVAIDPLLTGRRKGS